MRVSAQEPHRQRQQQDAEKQGHNSENYDLSRIHEMRCAMRDKVMHSAITVSIHSTRTHELHRQHQHQSTENQALTHINHHVIKYSALSFSSICGHTADTPTQSIHKLLKTQCNARLSPRHRQRQQQDAEKQGHNSENYDLSRIHEMRCAMRDKVMHSAITVSIHSTRTHELHRQHQHQSTENQAQTDINHDVGKYSALSFSSICGHTADTPTQSIHKLLKTQCNARLSPRHRQRQQQDAEKQGHNSENYDLSRIHEMRCAMRDKVMHSAITVSIHSTRTHELHRQHQHQSTENQAQTDINHDVGKYSALSFSSICGHTADTPTQSIHKLLKTQCNARLSPRHRQRQQQDAEKQGHNSENYDLSRIHEMRCAMRDKVMHSAITVSIHSTRTHELHRQHQHQSTENQAQTDINHDVGKY